MNEIDRDNFGRGISRRRLLQAMIAMGLFAGARGWAPAYARSAGLEPPANGPAAPVANELIVDKARLRIAGRTAAAITLNGSLPGPLLRLREGDIATLRVINRLDEPTSLHWHGVLVPHDMDGVPGVSFAGIPAGETFTYRFPLRQSGTYWYHSHSGMQEPAGVYGPLVIEPAAPEPFAYDRDYIVMLSDWSFEDPHRVLAHLKQDGAGGGGRRRAGAGGGRGGARRGGRAAGAGRRAGGRGRGGP